jgi:hypothetical protein
VIERFLHTFLGICIPRLLEPIPLLRDQIDQLRTSCYQRAMFPFFVGLRSHRNRFQDRCKLCDDLGINLISFGIRSPLESDFTS